jgi:TPR repeat protein
MLNNGTGLQMRQALFILLLLAVTRSWGYYTEANTTPPLSADVLSTNWLAAVREAIPSATRMRESDLPAITNLLCRESQRGNVAAQGLWGFLLLVQNHSPEAAEPGLRLLRGSATNGFVPAMVNLGLLMEGGQYVRQDYNEAFYWFNEAASRKNPDALLQLGGCYHYGLGTTQDLARAVDCYRRAAGLTNYVAMKSLGHMLMNGLGVGKDTNAARHWFLRAAKEGGNRRAMYNLGVLSCGTASDTNAMAEAFRWFKQSADSGDTLATFQVANFYYNGWGGVQTNLEAYCQWRLKAATLGATAAQYLMGVAYRTGDGVPKDIESSLAWYRKAAAKGHPSALYDLGVHYWSDTTNQLARSLAQDFMQRAARAGHLEAQFQCAMAAFRGDAGAPGCEDGKKWLAQAADSGWAPAEFLLFQLYYRGTRPNLACSPYPRDTLQALKWLRRAAEHQHLQAQAVLAVMLIQGTDVERNSAEAESLLRHGAERGYTQAQNDLGFAIQHGDTAKVDLVEAAMWCSLARDQTKDSNVLRRAEVNLANVLAKLGPEQRLEVDARVKDFRPIPVAEPNPLVKDWEQIPGYQPEDGRFGH